MRALPRLAKAPILSLWLALSPLAGQSETLDELVARGEGGDIDAQVELGYRYLHGLGVDRDLTASRQWFEIPAYKAQLPYAMTWMARAYLEEDNPTETDYVLARQFIDDAISLGDKEADLYLGWMVGMGLGTPVDREQGRRYILRAMRNGVEGAEDWLRRLEAAPIPDIRISRNKCEITFDNSEVFELWSTVGRRLGHPVPPDLHKYICTTTEGRAARVVEYMGWEEADKRYHFLTRFDGCDMRFQVEDTGSDYRYSMVFDHTCHLWEPPRRGSSDGGQLNAFDMLGQLFGLGGEMLIGGMAAVTGTSREELAASMSEQDSRCFIFSDNSDALNSCLNEPYLVKNEDAQNILLGFCHNLSDWAVSNGMDYICNYPGRDSCHTIKDSDHSYACHTCNGTRQWLAVYASGSVMSCYKN